MEELKLVEGIDNKFFDYLIKLYSPFLSSRYKNSKIKYTIFSNKYSHPIGIIALFNGRTKFIEIALVPNLHKKSYALEIIKLFLKKHPYKKIGWTVDKANLPSIKLLAKLNGGFFENTVKNKKLKQAEGFFIVNGKVPKKMQDNLEILLKESKEKYNKWLKEYKGRHKELNDLQKYLENYNKKNFNN